MAVLRRKRAKIKPKKKPVAGCAPAAAPKRRKPAKRGKRHSGGSGGGGADATAAAARRRALAAAKKKGKCAKPARRPARKPTAPKPAAAPLAAAPEAPTPAAPASTPEPPPTAPPPVDDRARRDAERLLWRAGTGPRPGDVDRLAALGRDRAVRAMLDPGDPDVMVGPAPTVGGAALTPYTTWGHDHLLFLDRLTRTTHPLRWRLTLVFHDWFATSRESVGVNHLLRQWSTIHAGATGRFDDLALAMTSDPAMLVWLDGIANARWSPNENHARELMELFLLGAGRDAYTETDVREAARAMTGFRATWTDATGFTDFRFDANRHDPGSKTIFGRTGAFGWEDVVRLCLEHPKHASWFVTRLWSAFVPEPADAATQAELERIYVGSGRQILPVVEAILRHPRFYDGPAMVTPPAVQISGTLRALGRGIDTDAWAWLGDAAGQLLFRPPSVAGWDEERWLSTATWSGRWYVATWALQPSAVDPWSKTAPYDPAETPQAAVERALAHLGNPTLTAETREALLRFASTAVPAGSPSWMQGPARGMRQNALRMLIATSADYLTS